MENIINEMARDVASTPLGTVKPDLTLTEIGDVYKGEFVMRIAKHLYNADYRKQKEGEWIKATEWMRDDGEIYDYRCSACNMLAEDGGYGNRDNLTNFCPNCGAKMKGGAE